MEEGENLDLGGNITLQGFSDIEAGKMVVVKKIVGNYVKRISDILDDFQELKVSLKNVHGDQSGNYEVKAQLSIGGSPYNSQVNDRNLFFAMDKVLKNIEQQLSKEKDMQKQ